MLDPMLGLPRAIPHLTFITQVLAEAFVVIKPQAVSFHTLPGRKSAACIAICDVFGKIITSVAAVSVTVELEIASGSLTRSL